MLIPMLIYRVDEFIETDVQEQHNNDVPQGRVRLSRDAKKPSGPFISRNLMFRVESRLRMKCYEQNEDSKLLDHL